MPTLAEAYEAFQQAEPMAFIEAGDHLFHCVCPPCVTFLATTGMDVSVTGRSDPRWIELRGEQVEMTDGIWFVLSDDQTARFRRVTSQHL